MKETGRIKPTEDVFRISGLYRDSNLEKEFNEKMWAGDSKKIRTASCFTGVAYLTGVFSDIPALGLSTQLAYMSAARIITFTAAMFCVYTSSVKFSRKNTQKRLLIYFLVITVSECFELLLKPELGKQALPFLIIIVFFYSLVFPVPPLYSFYGSLSAAILYSSILLFVHKYPLLAVMPTIIIFILVTLTSFHFSRNMKRANRSEAYAMIKLKKANEDLQNEMEERLKVQKRLEELATLDELTKIYNRRHFRELANSELQRAARTGESVSLLFMDIDHFKSVNDSYGHNVGDQVLKKIAEVCQSSIRDLDIFARLGGEEFVFLLPEINIHQAETTAERLRKIVAGTVIKSESYEIRITTSFGVSTYDKEKSETLDKMVKQADLALYEAKEKGRNRVEVWKGSL